jgi:membrane associated rhomboid family serine protease
MGPLGDCPRHPGRPALTTCTRCERGICEEDLVEAPVGYQCTDCARSGPPSHRFGAAPPPAVITQGALGLIALVAVLEALGVLDLRTFALVPVLVGLGEPWRLVTGALLHVGIVHLAFNALLLWNLGIGLEQRVGRPAFLGVLASGVAGGSLGVVLLAWLTAATPLRSFPVLGAMLATSPTSLTVGFSGAVFGLMGAVLGVLQSDRIDPRTTVIGSQIGGLVVLNLVLTFLVPAISVGGHVGGLAAGWVAGRALGPDGRGSRRSGPADGSPAALRRRVGSRGRTTATAPLVLSGALFAAAIGIARRLASLLIG